MSTRYNDGSHYENHPTAAELHNLAAHAHRVGELHGKQEHLTGHEQTRDAHDTKVEAEHHPHASTVGHGITAFGHSDIAALAHQLWIERGSPEGSPEVDWNKAVEELRARSYAHKP
jgi:Protein of unknown function (DUF2934)